MRGLESTLKKEIDRACWHTILYARVGKHIQKEMIGLESTLSKRWELKSALNKKRDMAQRRNI